MFKKTNYYWTIYKNLEKELLKISEIIYINNEQLMTFSPYIADLIIRCSIEIESISKELYKINNGPTLFDEEGKEKYLYFDSDCINFLNRKFLLDKKEITISFLNSYIDDDKLRTITPLKHANKQGEKRCKWKYAYQALKHDRINNLKEGNLLNFTQALGALYILNLYLKKEIFEEEYLDSRLNSDIFSINIFIPSGLEISEKMSEESYINFDKNNLKKAIYVKKIQDDFFKKIQDSFYQDYIETYKNFLEDETIKNFILDNDITGLNMNQIILRAGGTTLYTKLSCNNKWNLLKGNYKHEFILNCNMPIQEEISIKKDQANEA